MFTAFSDRLGPTDDITTRCQACILGEIFIYEIQMTNGEKGQNQF